MKCYLMHKNLIVALMDVSDNGELSKVEINKPNYEFVPVGGQMNMMKFHDWWKDRAVPRTRKGSTHALSELGFPNTYCMLVNNLALSLNDCYWIKPTDSKLCWEQVSLFSNNFIDIFGELTFDTSSSLDMRNKTLFRCASSQGELQKKWCIDSNEQRFLVKGNLGNSFQQSLNEVFASEIYKLQGINCYTPYELTTVSVEDGKLGLGCFSYNFCSEEVESISAWELLQTVKLKGNVSYYNAFKEVCKKVCGFKEEYVDKFLSLQIMVDFLITNTDRHMNNISVLRNTDTLEYIGFAPIYDNGNSMFFRSTVVPTGNFNKITTHSFLKYEKDLLKLVKYKDILDINALPSKEFFYNLYLKDIPERQQRVDSLWSAYQQKILLLDKIIHS